MGAYRFGSSYPELLFSDLQELDGSSEHPLTNDIPIPGDYELASQEAVEISLGFYIKVPTDYQSIAPNTFKTLASDNLSGDRPYRRVDFIYSSTGVGGTLSHIIKESSTKPCSLISPALNNFFLNRPRRHLHTNHHSR